ncbi:MAG TPA: hypothetical protein VNY81_05295 [Candidatus Saccharimonadales bacterium]|nr:hypothetical protein [Candidatus Saccharimonadales bacterium]
MIPAFDIFKTDRDGHLVWCSAASTLDDAKAQATALVGLNPCEYVIFSHKTNTHIRFVPPSSSPEK